jgi:hypothetical protein
MVLMVLQHEWGVVRSSPLALTLDDAYVRASLAELEIVDSKIIGRTRLPCFPPISNNSRHSFRLLLSRISRSNLRQSTM